MKKYYSKNKFQTPLTVGNAWHKKIKIQNAFKVTESAQDEVPMFWKKYLYLQRSKSEPKVVDEGLKARVNTKGKYMYEKN